MTRSTLFIAALAASWFSATATSAHAQAQEEDKPPPTFSAKNWPLALVDRPLVLAPFMAEFRGDLFRVEMSRDRVGDPVTMAPALFVGINKRVTVGVFHDIGICVSGNDCDDGTYRTYNDLGFEALTSVLYGGVLEIAGRAGLTFNPLSPFTTGIYMGVRAHMGGGSFALFLDPSVYVGLVGRDRKAEYVDVPIQLQFQLSDQNAAFLRTGVRGAMRDIGENAEVPVGIGGLFALGRRLDVGAEFLFNNLLGTGGNISSRVMFVRLAIRI
ncbi:hypothetical protein [Haliangium sp.]|uniref:hypothetical protein n=1 Tax=Haliangium sp. TaxID=2663208 RepID=UPI003D09D823